MQTSQHPLPAFLARVCSTLFFCRCRHPALGNSELPPLGGVRVWPLGGAGLPLATAALEAPPTPIPSSGLRMGEEGGGSTCQVCHLFCAEPLKRDLSVDLTQCLPRLQGVSSACLGPRPVWESGRWAERPRRTQKGLRKSRS